MALALPEASFVGLDLSQVQVNQGQQLIAELGLTNIQLQALDILSVDRSIGSFDYILAHGVYSWVPTPVQDKILAICAELLSPAGVAYVSYNTLPGWRMRGLVRDAMRYHVMQFPEPVERVGQARAILDFLTQAVSAKGDAYAMLLKSELETLKGAPDYYILHEHLEDINEPVYFHEFTEKAATHKLQYLAEADLTTMFASNFPEEINHILERIASDVIRQEQYMDFLNNRGFRQTLLVHAHAKINRTLTPERVKSLWISAALKPENTSPELTSQKMEVFHGAQGKTLTTVNPVTKAAILILDQRWPEALSFEDLSKESSALLAQSGEVPSQVMDSIESVLSSDILRCAVAGLFELHAGPMLCSSRPQENPKVSSLVRWQAAHGQTTITTLRHEVLHVDALGMAFLSLLDGTRDKATLCQDYAKKISTMPPDASIGIPIDDMDNLVDQMLSALARSAVLLAR
jgi:methyltransferase-like protein